MEGGRPSQPRWLATYPDCHPFKIVLTGLGVEKANARRHHHAIHMRHLWHILSVDSRIFHASCGHQEWIGLCRVNVSTNTEGLTCFKNYFSNINNDNLSDLKLLCMHDQSVVVIFAVRSHYRFCTFWHYSLNACMHICDCL